jgi:hypothetical protein
MVWDSQRMEMVLLAAMVVIVSQRHPYVSTKLTQQREFFAAIVGRKSWALVVAIWAFGVARVAFAGLFVVATLGISPPLAVSWPVDRGVAAAPALVASRGSPPAAAWRSWCADRR